ncbi:MAG: hypothetical protein JRJ85_01545 [Deltaproteobacteria bacterium]|nr:hypothetical protein [Deltaproteobacteria bacterium]
MKRKIPWFPAAIFFFLIIAIPVHPSHAKTTGSEEVFFSANQSYRDGRFQDAIEGYLHLIQAGYVNGHIYYNLGNAYMRNNDLGEAVLNYEKARIRIPRDADLNFNLRYARDRRRDAVTPSRGFIDQTFFWLHDVTLYEVFWVFSIMNILFWAVLGLRLFVNAEWTYYFLIILIIFWCISGISFGLKWYQVKTDHRAVILPDEVNILAGPQAKDTILFKLHEGAVVHHERSEGDWSLVHLPDRKRGWLPVKAIAMMKE